MCTQQFHQRSCPKEDIVSPYIIQHMIKMKCIKHTQMHFLLEYKRHGSRRGLSMRTVLQHHSPTQQTIVCVFRDFVQGRRQPSEDGVSLILQFSENSQGPSPYFFWQFSCAQRDSPFFGGLQPRQFYRVTANIECCRIDSASLVQQVCNSLLHCLSADKGQFAICSLAAASRVIGQIAIGD